MKHTPGNWTIHWNGKSSAEVHGPRYEIALLNGYVSEEELEANVQLIAAAPDLLEALNRCRRTIKVMYEIAPNYHLEGALKEAEAAIVQAGTQEVE